MNLDLTLVRESAATVCRAIEGCKAIARERGQSQWLSLRWKVADRDVLADFLACEAPDAFYWQEPGRELAILGLGRLDAIEASGRDRFADAADHSRDLFSNLQLHCLDASDSAAAADRGPLLLGGFAFFDSEVEPESEWHGFGAGRLLLPEITIVCRDKFAWVTRTCAVEPDSRIDEVFDGLCAEIPSASPHGKLDSTGLPSKLGLIGEVQDPGPEFRVQADRTHTQYLAQVEAALDAITAGKFEKVVLARSLRVIGDQDFDLASFLSSLRAMFPSCATLAIRDGDDLFVSATPERLVALDGDQVTTAAVAGSAPRGRNPQEEEHFSVALCESEKERHEHDVVKYSIQEALAESCGNLEGPAVPNLLKLEGIQHLETPLSGRLLGHRRGTTSVLDLVAQLHPTPAVGGAPRATALDWLEHFEALDRGWYAGPVGYVDGRGDGEFRVALRSALLRGRSARLFAGAGIVAGSEPSHELAETRLKLRALLAPLTEI
ncbi:MAG: isochorismate synthase [Myxococcales bacterium]|nr:isochorismate synthase [Myxococcales bacterium]